MQRSVEASAVVEVPIGRAHAILLGDPTGIVMPPLASTLRGAVEVEVGSPRREGEEVRVPVSVRSLDGGSLWELVAELAVVAAGVGTRLELGGTYRWDIGGNGYGGGVLAHRVARWLATDLVNGVGDRIVRRMRPSGGGCAGTLEEDR